jgi:5'-nucleotidase
MSRVLAIVAALAVGCGHAAAPAPAPHPAPPPPPDAGVWPPPHPVKLTIIGTNDTHGALDRLPILAGYVDNARVSRKLDDGAVVVIDAGDLFQGTLESNLTEGAPVIDAFDAIGYDAAAVGNHEFDFGPVGPTDTPKPGEDPRGALKARVAQAKFPLLAANLIDKATGARPDWLAASTLITAGGVKVGIVGVITEDTPSIVRSAVFDGLAVTPAADAIVAEAKALRAKGAQVVIVAAHLGGKCTKLDDPDDTSSCDPDQEIMKVVPAIPHGLVDVIVAGHTHQAMAQRIDGIAVIESFASGRAFGRVDLTVSTAGAVTDVQIFPTKDLCPDVAPSDGATPDLVTRGGPGKPCAPGTYEGREVVPSKIVQDAVQPAIDAAKAKREQPVGVSLASPFPAVFDAECAEGDLFTDLMLAVHEDADVAITNGGGLRADLPAGALSYGALFAAIPFDNRFAIVRMHGKDLRAMIAGNLRGRAGIISLAGVTAKAACKDGDLDVKLYDRKGKPVADDRALVIVTSDFLAQGGDGAIGKLGLPDGSIALTDVIIRDAMADELKRRGGSIDARRFFDPKKPRLAFEGHRPITCAK